MLPVSMNAFILAAVIPLVAGHGYFVSPKGRVAGSKMASVCGEQIYNNQAADEYGNVQGEEQLIQSDYTSACNLWLCKGYQYADNTDNVQSYSAGQTIDMKYNIRAPHTGYANVSIVDTSTNSVIGSPLMSWDVYASTSTTIPANETSFSITMPDDLGGKCTKGGECVIQHFWNAPSVDQTYESCIDFTIDGSSAASASGSASSAVVASSSTVAAATSTSAAAAVQVAVSSSSAAPDDTCDPEETTSGAVSIADVTSTVTAAPAATSSTDSGDDDDCDADTESAAVPTASASASVSHTIPTTFLTIASSSSSAPAATGGSSSGTVPLYGQCGGQKYSGSKSCARGKCVVQNAFYSQCIEA